MSIESLHLNPCELDPTKVKRLNKRLKKGLGQGEEVTIGRKLFLNSDDRIAKEIISMRYEEDLIVEALTDENMVLVAFPDKGIARLLVCGSVEGIDEKYLGLSKKPYEVTISGVVYDVLITDKIHLSQAVFEEGKKSNLMHIYIFPKKADLVGWIEENRGNLISNGFVRISLERNHRGRWQINN